jgi:hypothetical protein
MSDEPEDDDDDWPGFARCCAQAAFEGSRSTPYGLYACKDEDPEGTINVLVLYNNQPHPDDPLLRDLEMEEIRRRLREEGIGELALATYPIGGPDDGHTYAMVLDVGEGLEDLVMSLVSEAMEACRERKEE